MVILFYVHGVIYEVSYKHQLRIQQFAMQIIMKIIRVQAQERESLTIPFFLNSAATIPDILVPIGSPDLFIKTHALSSNRTALPSFRPTSFLARTITACRISPRLTLFAADTIVPVRPVCSEPKDRCFCTTTTMRSPIEAGRLRLRRVMHSTIAAPELSMQLRRV